MSTKPHALTDEQPTSLECLDCGIGEPCYCASPRTARGHLCTLLRRAHWDIAADDLQAGYGTPATIAEKLRRCLALDGNRAPTPDEAAALLALDTAAPFGTLEEERARYNAVLDKPEAERAPLEWEHALARACGAAAHHGVEPPDVSVGIYVPRPMERP
jgi:hypothetical protein